MTPVSPWFATARMLNEIGLVRAQTREARFVQVEQQYETRRIEAPVGGSGKAPRISRI